MKDRHTVRPLPTQDTTHRKTGAQTHAYSGPRTCANRDWPITTKQTPESVVGNNRRVDHPQAPQKHNLLLLIHVMFASINSPSDKEGSYLICVGF
jgi:hypothetical protein